MMILPANAQVVAHQGQNHARCSNLMDECEANLEGPLRLRGSERYRFHPIRYRHQGEFDPLGGEQIAMQLPGDWVLIGQSPQWLWYSVYPSKIVRSRTKDGIRLGKTVYFWEAVKSNLLNS
ncbi:hypothetical protein GIB67_041300 [Kingdonia uniflora]|uniref:Uncharacterized protein n=1 Tax=Kingdonia uniflora TaxID=39325 RepID=A0A7J7NIM8_9MAGN|nr:hypothetical protein GIB67_041300 [Kingdonia uniflora]